VRIWPQASLRWAAVQLLLAALATTPAAGQERATVAVDDSPTAIQLLAQASDQAAANPAESARLVRQVLTEMGRKLVPLPDDPDRFTDARGVAERLLLSNPEVLRRWRALESAEARRQVDAGDLGLATTQRLLTPAGLEAQLALADDELTHARFAKALILVEAVKSHPDLVQDMLERARRIEALAAWGAGQQARAIAIAGAGPQPEGPGAAAHSALGALIAGAPPATAAEVNDPLAPQPFGDVGGSPIRLWQDALDQSLKRRMQMSVDDRRRAPLLPESATDQGLYLVSVPALEEGLVIVNEGHRLQAIGAFTREPVWSVLMMSPSAPRDGRAGDLAAPVVCAGRVLAVSGHSSGADRDGGERDGGGRLVCVSLADGRRLWEFLPRWHARAGLDGMFIVGSPAVIEDTVAIMLRRVSARQETISTAVGISLLDGSLRWVSPLGATPGIRIASSGIRPCTTPVAMGDSFLFSSGAGVNARLSFIDGRPMWVRRDPVPVRDARWELSPWQMQRPVVSARGILVVDPEQQHIQVLDADDGRQLSLIPVGIGTAWRGTRWLLGSADGAHVLGIGDEVICFSADDLRTPRWSMGLRSGNASEAAPVVGRVQVGVLSDGSGAVAIPTGGRISVRTLADGAEICSLEVGAPANPSLRHGIASAATDDALSMYVDSTRTERALLAAARQGEPTALAGLLELAIASSRTDLARTASQMASDWLPVPTAAEGAAAEDAAAAGPELADRVAALLVDVACSGLLDARESTALFDRVIAREGDPSRRAQALLLQGEWFERSGRNGAAVAVWRRILADSALASSWLQPQSDDGAFVRAGIAARQRLENLGRAHEDASARRVDAGMPGTGASASALAAYARMAAYSPQAVDAWIASAEAAAAAGNRPFAAHAASMAVDEAITLGETSRVAATLERVLALLAKEALPDTAAHLVDRAVTSGMDVPLPSQRGEPASRLRAQMPSSSLVRGEPRVGGARGPRVVQALRGEPTLMTRRARLTRPTDRLWLTDRSAITCLSADSLAPLWRMPLVGAPVTSQSPALVQFAPSGAVMWEMLSADRSSLSFVDDAGSRRWTVDDCDTLIDGDAPDAAAVPGAVPRPGRESMLQLAGVIPGPSDIVLVRGDGAMAAVDAAEGSLLWRARRTLAEVIDADADDAVVAIAGRAMPGDSIDRVMLIDRASGKPIALLADPDVGSVRWVRIVGPGQVAVGHDQGTSRWDLSEDRVSWIRDDTGGRRSTGIDGVGSTMLMSAEGRPPQAIRWGDGAILSQAYPLLTGRWQRPVAWEEFVRTGDAIVAGDEQRVGLFALDGTQLGATIPIPGRTLHSVTPVGAGLVVTEQAGRAEVAAGVGMRPRARLKLQLLGWSDGLKISGPGSSVDLPAPVTGTPLAVDGWIVVTTSKDSSYALPIPTG
jgi:hypothetical protein